MRLCPALCALIAAGCASSGTPECLFDPCGEGRDAGIEADGGAAAPCSVTPPPTPAP
ncbi:MAG: hypothetical protein M5U28_04910 [Sandaracinaceae bacterium]|nr:hypothetical protein [Sandaracinaceae bacterium]